ncbi:MAG: hypothetical protein JSW68_03115 [Burkholderiales bacterium]|nr:MAG: hypothetical protein JSW68_03115 [Burkholderiales bacterium]
MKSVAALALVLCSNVAFAACPPARFTAAADVRLRGDAVLIVTHATSAHDARLATKRGVDEAVRYAKSRRIRVVYLQDDGPEAAYFAQDCEPDFRVASESGEVEFALTPARVYIAGGHLELCLSRTVHDLLLAWSRQPKRHLTLTYLMDAIYSNGKSIEETDAWYPDFQRFMRVVTRGRPGGEHWPKLTLLETLGVINSNAQELAYLERILPHYARTMPAEYRIELQFGDSVTKVLRPAPGWNPPTLRFEFVDSALSLQD